MRGLAGTRASGVRHSGRGTVVTLTLLALLAPTAAMAAPAGKPDAAPAYLPGTLFADAKANPGKKQYNIRVANFSLATGRLRQLGDRLLKL